MARGNGGTPKERWQSCDRAARPAATMNTTAPPRQAALAQPRGRCPFPVPCRCSGGGLVSGGGLPHGLVDHFGDVDQGGPTQLKGKRTSGGSVLSPKVRMQGRDAAKEKAHG